MRSVFHGLSESGFGTSFSCLNPQPSTLNLQSSTLNPQPSTLNPQPSTLKAQPSNINPQPSTFNAIHDMSQVHTVLEVSEAFSLSRCERTRVRDSVFDHFKEELEGDFADVLDRIEGSV